jgi:hypothetical protein
LFVKQVVCIPIQLKTTTAKTNDWRLKLLTISMDCTASAVGLSTGAGDTFFPELYHPFGVLGDWDFFFYNPSIISPRWGWGWELQ